MKKKIDGKNGELVTNGLADGPENVTILPKPVESDECCRAMSKLTERQPVTIEIKIQNVAGFSHGRKIAQNHNTHAQLR